MRLSGKTILVTRAEQQAGDLTDLIESEGGRTVMFPMIHITDPETWELCDHLQDGIGMYNGLLFSSTNAVVGFLDRLWERRGSVDSLRNVVIYAVGEKTAARIRKYGLEVSFVPEQFTAHDLTESLTNDMVEGKRFIFPRGNLGSHIIAKHIRSNGGEIDEVIVYRTVPPEQRNIDLVRRYLESNQLDAITFTSPSTARNFFTTLPEYPYGTTAPLLAAIGPVTAAALETLGHTANIVASPSTMEGLVESLAAYFAGYRV